MTLTQDGSEVKKSTHNFCGPRFPRNEGHETPRIIVRHCYQNVVSQDLHVQANNAGNGVQRRWKPNSLLRRKRVGSAGCELKKRDIDSCYVLRLAFGPSDVILRVVQKGHGPNCHHQVVVYGEFKFHG